MSESGYADKADQSKDVDGCRNLSRGLAANHFNFNVYALNITIRLMDAENNHWSLCLDTIPTELVPSYLEYLHREVEACDFKPFPSGFLFGGESEADIERTKAELRPRYVALVEFAKNRLTGRKMN